MKLTRSRLNKIINCKIQTKKKRITNTNTNTLITKRNENENTKKQKTKYFNLRNNTVKNWVRS
jgi:hypothetical protein